jgi:hypothetical protein
MRPTRGLPAAEIIQPLIERARRRIQTLLTVLGAMFHLSNCEKADLHACIAD